MSDINLDELRDELSDLAEPEKKGGRPAREERIIAGFEEVQQFVEKNGRLPLHGEDRDIFERLYAVRLDRLRAQADCRALLEPLDHQGLLKGAEIASAPSDEEIDEDKLLEELGDIGKKSGIRELKHVRAQVDRRAAEEIAQRTPCSDFDKFRPLFAHVQEELKTGVRKTRPFELKAEIRPGAYFIVSGQMTYVAEMDDIFTNDQGRTDARLRVIYDNGTESNILMRSLQRALHKDEAGRRITNPSAGPLFSSEVEETDASSGTIYVLRSKSQLPQIKEHRDVIHKIGVTGSDIQKRIADAKNDPTFLMADVEIVATYELLNINRTKLENLIHRFFEPAKLNIEIKDRFGKPVVPREWFLVPLFVIDEVVEKIKDGSIVNYGYDPKAGKLVELSGRT
jgi:hypothetical protein